MSVKKKKIKLICKKCGSIFYLLPCQTKHGRGKYCSKKCSNKSYQRGSSLVCDFCGISFYKTLSEQKRVNSNFCTVMCYQKYRAAMIKETTYKKTGTRHTHRVVAEIALDRKLLPEEIVHHIDEDRHNNNISNLAVLPNNKIHATIHFSKISPIKIEDFMLSNIIKNVGKYNEI